MLGSEAIGLNRTLIGLLRFSPLCTFSMMHDVPWLDIMNNCGDNHLSYSVFQLARGRGYVIAIDGVMREEPRMTWNWEDQWDMKTYKYLLGKLATKKADETDRRAWADLRVDLGTARCEHPVLRLGRTSRI